MMLLGYEAYEWWFLIRWSVELKNWLMIFIDMIYWMFSLAYLSLLHLLGRLLLDLFVVGVSADSEFFHVVCGVIFLVCTYFCYFSVIAFLVGGYEYLYGRFIAVPGCRWSFSSTYLLESWGAVWVIICAFVVKDLWVEHVDEVIIVFISSGWWIGFSKWGQCWQRVLVGISFVWLFGL